MFQYQVSSFQGSRAMLAPALLALLLSACASGPYSPSSAPDVVPPTTGPASNQSRTEIEPKAPTTQQPAQKPDSSRTIAKGVRTERSRPSPAAQSMIEKARAARQSGDLNQASSLLERAQRMSPQAAEVYYELAAVKMEAGSFVEAEQFCQKALALSGDDSRFRANIWQRIAEIREARGDKRGAQEAREKARGQG